MRSGQARNQNTALDKPGWAKYSRRMKRFTAIESCGFVFGILFFCAGLALVIWPQAGVVLHLTNDALGLFPHREPEVISPATSCFYGILAIVVGAGLAIGSAYHEKQ